jgi:hypothetical protein
MVSNLIVGAHTYCMINSAKFARVAGMSYEITTPYRELHGIDTLLPIELIPGGVSFTGTMTIFRMHRDGGIEAAGMIPTWNTLTKGKYFSITIKDRATDTVLLNADKCCIQKQGWRVEPKSHVMGTIQFSGIKYENEAEEKS